MNEVFIIMKEVFDNDDFQCGSWPYLYTFFKSQEDAIALLSEHCKRDGGDLSEDKKQWTRISNGFRYEHFIVKLDECNFI